jgi:hypothetical protein
MAVEELSSAEEVLVLRRRSEGHEEQTRGE